MPNRGLISKIHLVISVIIVIPAAVIYGFDLDGFLDLNPNTVDAQNFSTAVMGLYLGFSTLWLLGVFKTKYLNPALISNFIFMCGLGFGRLLSMIVDGIPSAAYIFGTVGELILGFYGFWVLKTYYKHTAYP